MDTITTRIKAITQIPAECLVVKPPAPKSVKIELTPRCNYRCAYCGILNRDKQPNQDMDFWVFKSLAQELKEIGVQEIGLFLTGEPFMNPGLIVRAVSYLKGQLKFPYVFLTSNGSMAYPNHMTPIMEAGLDSFKWSYNAGDPEQFTALTGMSAKFWHSTNENIQAAWKIRQDRGLSTKLYASSIYYSDAHAEKMKVVLAEKILPYVDEHYWLPLYSMGGLAKDREVELGLVPTPGNIGMYYEPVAPIPCWTLFTAGHVLYDGRVTACCADATGGWVVGDLKDNSFMEIWHSEEFQALRQAHLSKDITGTKCENCLLLR